MIERDEENGSKSWQINLMMEKKKSYDGKEDSRICHTPHTPSTDETRF